MHSNVISRRVLTLSTTNTLELVENETIVNQAADKLREQLDAEIHVGRGQDDSFILVIESAGTDDMDEIIDFSLDLQRELGTAQTTIRLVDSYGEVILGEDYVAD